MHMIAAIQASLLEGLSALSDEVRQFANDDSLWETRGAITNSSGTLVLHLIGNLHHYIGAQLGATGYVRQRDLEFSTVGRTREELVQECVEAAEMIRTALHGRMDVDLAAPYPLAAFGEARTVGEVLLRLVAHFRYHLGQVNYLRRML